MAGALKWVPPPMHHWTEQDPRVIAYLEERIGPVTERERGADLEAGGMLIEVKAAQEWISDACARTGRRRGRFRLATWEDNADYFLFVLVMADGSLRMKLVEPDEVFKRFPLEGAVIPAGAIFAPDLLDLDYVLPRVTPGKRIRAAAVTP
jgi:hypothetical protein